MGMSSALSFFLSLISRDGSTDYIPAVKDKTKTALASCLALSLSCLVFVFLNLVKTRKQTKKTRHQDNVFEISRLRSFKDKTQDMSWKPPELLTSPRSNCGPKDKTKTKN